MILDNSWQRSWSWLWWLRYTEYKDYTRDNVCRSWNHGNNINFTAKKKVKRDKLAALYRHLNVTGDPDLADIDRVKLCLKKFKDRKNWFTDLLFLTTNTGNRLLINVLVIF